LIATNDITILSFT